MPSAYDPLWMFRIPMPLSGDVSRPITTPWFSLPTKANFAGDAAIEERIVAEVASYGKQLGWLTEVTLAMAKQEMTSADTLHKLEAVAKDIEAIKADHRHSSLDTATDALDRLKRDDPEGYEKLMTRSDAEHLSLHIEFSEFLTRHDLTSVLQSLDATIEKHFIHFITREDPDGATESDLRNFFNSIPEHTFFSIMQVERGSVILDIFARFQSGDPLVTAAVALAAPKIGRALAKGLDAAGGLSRKIITDVIEEFNMDVDIWLENRRRVRKVRLRDNNITSRKERLPNP